MGGTLRGPGNGGGGFEGAKSDGRADPLVELPEEVACLLCLVRASDPRSVGRLGEAVLVLGSLVGVERS